MVMVTSQNEKCGRVYKEFIEKGRPSTRVLRQVKINYIFTLNEMTDPVGRGLYCGKIRRCPDIPCTCLHYLCVLAHF